MTTGLQLALAGGLLMGAAVALLVWRLAPSDPDLVDALDRLSPRQVARQRAADADAAAGDTVLSAGLADRLGAWGIKNLPGEFWLNTPAADLAILRISYTRFYGEKLLYALVGLALPPLMAFFFDLIGLGLPIVVPVAGSLAAAAGFFFLPNYNVRDDAKKARVEFNRALGSFIELVALERRSGASSRQALMEAAQVGDSWVFERLGQELHRAEYIGRAPWDSLHAMASELDVPELDDLADIMQLSGQDGAQIYANLRARASAMRSAMLSAEVGKANEAAERMYVPASLVGIIFMAILVTPSMLRVMGGA